MGAEESDTHNNCVMTQAVDQEGRSVWLEVSTQEAPLRNKKGYLHVKYTLSSRKTAEGMGQNQGRYLECLHVTSNIQHQARGLLVVAPARGRREEVKREPQVQVSTNAMLRVTDGGHMVEPEGQQH